MNYLQSKVTIKSNIWKEIVIKILGKISYKVNRGFQTKVKQMLKKIKIGGRLKG